MRAAVLHGLRDLRVEDRAEPRILKQGDHRGLTYQRPQADCYRFPLMAEPGPPTASAA